MIYTSLMYHEIVSPKLHKFSVGQELFEKQMKRIVEEGIHSYSFDNDYPSTTNEKYCLLTFDDGHASNLQAARLLKELGLVGYFYLIKDWSLEREDYLSESEIKEIASMGHKLGVHGKCHGQWAKMEENRVVAELRETKDWIEQLTGQEVNTCSAPGGSIDQRTINLIRREIPELKYIRTSRYGINKEGDTIINSVGIKGDYSVDKVVRLANNDFWEMRKVMTYYYAKEYLKPLYHIIKKS